MQVRELESSKTSNAMMIFENSKNLDYLKYVRYVKLYNFWYQKYSTVLYKVPSLCIGITVEPALLLADTQSTRKRRRGPLNKKTNSL